MARPNHFEIPVDDPDRAENFYAKVFDWKFQRFEGAPSYYGMASTGDGDPGINGALYQRTPEAGTVLTMGVESIEETTARITEHGGRVITDKSPIPGMGYYATCQDSEGNTIGLFVSDESAQAPGG